MTQRCFKRSAHLGGNDPTLNQHLSNNYRSSDFFICSIASLAQKFEIMKALKVVTSNKHFKAYRFQGYIFFKSVQNTYMYVRYKYKLNS